MRLLIFLFFIGKLLLAEEFEKLKNVFSNTNTLKLSFRQTVTYDWYPKPERSRGILYVKRGEFLRIDYMSPERLTLIADKNNVYLINYEQKTVYVESMKRNTSPVVESLFLLSKPLDETFTLVGKKKENGITVLLLEPKKKDENLNLVKLYVRRDGTPFKLVLYDSQGAKIEIEFIELKRNFRPRDELFKIKIPDEFKVIRYG
ncbi:MAG: hypothetical protein GXO04_04180 [Aquificae bacterium]|nr:hypothetical protein [Aquificota bacterium]